MPQGQFPVILPGMDYAAALIQSLASITAYKAGDTSRSNTATPAADPDLTLPVAANATYLVFGYVFATGAAISTADIAITFTGPAGSAFHYTTLGYSTAAIATLAMSAARTSGNAAQGVNGSAASPILILAEITTSGTPGSFALNWAQNTPNATATVLKAGSRLAAIRMA
jgi:hypothetical protein